MKLGINFDYKKGFKRVLLWYVANFLISLSLALLIYFNYTDIRKSGSMYIKILFIIARKAVHFVTATILTAYFIMTSHLCNRFDILNNLLRWFLRYFEVILNFTYFEVSIFFTENILINKIWRSYQITSPNMSLSNLSKASDGNIIHLLKSWKFSIFAFHYRFSSCLQSSLHKQHTNYLSKIEKKKNLLYENRFP